MKEGIYENFVNKLYYPEDINYVATKKRPEHTEIEDVIEIDIDQAYWQTAYLLGVVPENLYKEGSKEVGKISKIGRLICLGSLAKKEVVYHFKGKRLLKQETIRSVLTENIWYSICKRVADLMVEAKKIAGNDFMLYWVDGIYIKNDPEKVKLIVEMFKKNNYDIKTKDNLTVRYTEDKILVSAPDEKKPRPFFMQKKDKKRSYFTDEQLKETALEFSKVTAIDDLK